MFSGYSKYLPNMLRKIYHQNQMSDEPTHKTTEDSDADSTKIVISMTIL